MGLRRQAVDGVDRMAASTGAAALTKLMDAITLTSGQRPLLAGRRARYVERYSSRGRCDGEATYRCGCHVTRGTDSARGDELALIWSGPLPRAKCSGAGRDGRRSWSRG